MKTKKEILQEECGYEFLETVDVLNAMQVYSDQQNAKLVEENENLVKESINTSIEWRKFEKQNRVLESELYLAKERIKELDNRIFELDKLGTIAILENKELYSEKIELKKQLLSIQSQLEERKGDVVSAIEWVLKNTYTSQYTGNTIYNKDGTAKTVAELYSTYLQTIKK